MGTETRVGIAAGLLIVVVASVYFFYGSRPDEDELLISSATRVTAPPKIPVRNTGSTFPSHSANNQLGPDQPRRFASAGAGGKQPPSRAVPSLTERLAGGNDPQSAARRRPSRPNPAAGSPSPANDAASPPVPLRSGPSQELVEATWDHLLTPQPQNQNPLADPEKTSDDAVSRTSRTTAADRLRGPTSPLSRADRPLIDAPPSALSSSAATSTAGLNAAGQRPAAAWPKRHKIVEGDRLYAIAEDYYADPSLVSAILAANPQIKNPRALRIGDVILIPEPQPSSRAAEVSPRGRPPLANPAAPAAAKSYTVQSGDRLYTIAERLYGSGARWQEIYRLNQKLLKNDPDRLSPGMVLKLPD